MHQLVSDVIERSISRHIRGNRSYTRYITVAYVGKLELQLTNRSVLDTYANTNFSLLPLKLERFWTIATSTSANQNETEYIHAISELARYVGILELYEEFADTCTLGTYADPKARRSVTIRDQFYLCAYMSRNSKLDLDATQVSIFFALQYIDHQYECSDVQPISVQSTFVQSTFVQSTFVQSDVSRLDTDSSNADRLLLEWSDRAETIFKEHVAIHNFFHEQCKDELQVIASFVVLHQRQMNTERPFLRNDHTYDIVKPITLFEQLSISDRLEIAGNRWRSINLARCSDTYLIVLKLLFDTIVDRSLHTRHPYLIARYGNPFEIAQHIVQQCGGDDKRMRILATSYAIVAEINLPDLTSKCLILLNHSRKGTLNFGF